MQKLLKLNASILLLVITINSLTALLIIVLNAKNLVTKTEYEATLQDISKKITSNKSKHLLVENELEKLQKFDSSYFRGRNRFEEDGVQSYLVFQAMYKYFK